MDFVSFFNAVKPAYEIEQSLRFNSADNAYLQESSIGVTTTCTISWWHKKAFGSTSNTHWYIGSYPSGWTFESADGSSNGWTCLNGGGSLPGPSGSKYRDYSAWHHWVFTQNGNTSTMWLNGVKVKEDTSNSGSSKTGWRIGEDSSGSNNLNGYMAEFIFLDGTAVSDPNGVLGEFNNGVWRPIAYSGSYGTDGFYLKFDPTATNGIGHDHSGNGNNFTANNFTTSGTGTDVMSDTPTKNWCTMNPLFDSGAALSNGNLYGYLTSDGVTGTIGPTSGKWYWETTVESLTTNAYIGIADDTLFKGDSSFTYSQTYLYLATGVKGGNGSTTSYGATYGAGDIIGVAFDLDTPSIRFYKNGVDQGEAFNSLNNSGSAYRPFAWTQTGGHTYNFGQREFAFPPGTASATDYFNTVTYTGNGNSGHGITGVGFQPDLVWIKNRDVADHHALFDVVRGVGNYISSNRTNAEATDSNSLTAFGSDGFTVSTSNLTNYNGQDYVAWCWKAGGTASANNTGTINANVSANQDAGFSVVTYTGGGSAGTVAHGLSSAPKVYFVKNRSSATAYNWYVYHDDLSSAGHFLKLNSADSETASPDPFNNTDPTSSVISVGGENVVNGVNYVAYCFADVSGVAKHGTYTGTGAAGNYVELGFKPACVILKRRSGSASHWYLYDSKRGADSYVLVNSSAAETTNTSEKVLLTQSGFLLQTSAAMNTSGAPYVYMAFAENFTASDTYKSLNTANLPAPTIKNGSDNFNTVLYTGTGTTNARTDVGFQPDLTWIKLRNAASSHSWYDVLRGPTKVIGSNATSAESTDGSVTPTSTGFTLGSENSSFGSTNGSGYNYVAWNWLAGGSGSSNTDGSITSTVSANASAGFSIVSYTGTGSTATVGHGLGVAPSVIIFKNRDDGGTYDNWSVYHSAYSPSSVLYLNTQDQLGSASSFFDTAPTSTVFQVKTENKVNGSGDDHIAYCFAEVEGYSKFGSYSGNGNSNGPFVYTGFKPAWLMVKKNASSTDWKIYDAGRETYNVVANRIAANTSGAELDGNAQEIDFVSNGFKFRGTNGDQNSSGTFYYIAFASSPFGGSGVSPATAR